VKCLGFYLFFYLCWISKLTFEKSLIIRVLSFKLS
jgi:hypothetical protein